MRIMTNYFIFFLIHAEIKLKINFLNLLYTEHSDFSKNVLHENEIKEKELLTYVYSLTKHIAAVKFTVRWPS